MRYRMPFVMGLAVGYVLGSRAGRERYEQIKRTAQRVADNPRVQEAAGVVGAQMSKAGETARSKVGPLQERMPFRNRHRHDGEAGTGWPEETADQPKAAGQSRMPY
ncbi:YtxH domain-containing protein [Nonomuraea sp. NPDC049714]|uniref:YtxH domain-containing protein n=1 Tax=Nonomuraea sp. NPDC049714 TaxID=3364357 RepID=UPI0037A4B4EF